MAKPVENKDEKAPSSKKESTELNPTLMMLLSNVVVVAIVVIGMIIMYVSLDSSFTKKIEKLMPENAQGDEEGDEEKQEAILLDLGDFILNLADVGVRRYLKVGVAIELSKTEAEVAAASAPVKASGHGESAPDPTAAIIAEMDRYKPAIRDAVISILSSKTSDELSSPTGKEIAKDEIFERVNSIFDGQREVMRVNFGQFIIQ